MARTRRSRRDEDYEDDFEEDRPRRRKSQMSLFVTLSVCGLTAFALLAFLAAWFGPVSSGPALKSREEVRQSLLGKTKDETIRLVGRPRRTFDSGGSSCWTYDAWTLNPVTLRPDRDMNVWFSSDKPGVDRVRFD